MSVFDKLSSDLKKVAAEFALDKGIRYITKDPEKNLPIIMNFLEKAAVRSEHKEVIVKLKRHFKEHPNILEQARRIATNPDVISNLICNWVINYQFVGAGYREKKMKELGVHIPSLILVDPTSACNLRCKGCWAGEYKKSDQMEPELFDRILTEAEELGIYWIVLSGGEPFVYPYLLDIIEKHPRLTFMCYTNGTLIDDKAADRLAKVANFSPAISLEGWEESTDARRGKGTYAKVMAAMDRLLERGVPFGTSVTVMRDNVEELFSEEFIEFLANKGCTYMWSFHYIPIGRKPDTSLMITPEQRAWLARRVPQLRTKYPILIADFWNDGEFTKGCIAGGKTYFHINAAGEVEPCAFVHFAADNIKGKSLVEVLKNPLFKAYQSRMPFNSNHLCPCPIIDNPQMLRDCVAESGAHPTHEGADTIIKGEIAAFLDDLSARWQQEAAKVKAERESG